MMTDGKIVGGSAGSIQSSEHERKSWKDFYGIAIVDKMEFVVSKLVYDFILDYVSSLLKVTDQYQSSIFYILVSSL